jgi:DnaJ-class molecular chaperone
MKDHDYFGKYRWEICAECDGHGRRDHPAFSNGITSSEWAEWDPDDRETYMRGGYDVPCGDCGGSGKVRVPDVARMTFAEKRVLVDQRREARAAAANREYDRAEARMWAHLE